MQLPVVVILATFGSGLSAQTATSASVARQGFNQVFVKVIVPVTERAQKQDGHVVESWAAEELKEVGESEYFAVTDWVAVCDGLLTDSEIDNRVWNGSLGNVTFCPVEGDLPERRDGRVLVSVAGWVPVAGYEARVSLADEPGTRVVEPVRVYAASGKMLQNQNEKPIAYVAILIGPPPHDRHQALPNAKKDAANGSRRECGF